MDRTTLQRNAIAPYLAPVDDVLAALDADALSGLSGRRESGLSATAATS